MTTKTTHPWWYLLYLFPVLSFHLYSSSFRPLLARAVGSDQTDVFKPARAQVQRGENTWLTSIQFAFWVCVTHLGRL